ncbi:30S ribosomal protein S17, chloroplastic [Arachis duranensis]|uniref:Small ribosomal subunit protein uS17c n=1 Tax=Arachis duranensis TaxID=130453 RepID=A0A6P4D5U0_ARADU|nr:30S ribosomal protein S17, chloroplastic [Arachis duranensis]
MCTGVPKNLGTPNPSPRMWLLQLPSIPKFSTPFLHGGRTLCSAPTATTFPAPSAPCSMPTIRAMKSMQGKVVCATNDKTVAVEVVRLAPHPKYKRRVRKKKKYQAHDPDNQFKVGDIVQLLKSRPISKTKAFVAVSVPKKDSTNNSDIGIPLESQQQA